MGKRWIAGLLFGLATSSLFAGGGLDGFLADLNIQARRDMNGFSAQVGAQFDTPQGQVRAVLSTVSDPADAFMVFQLSRWTHRPPEHVMKVYRANKGRGWGAMAKELGIKPGSAEFHALKRGDLRFGDASEDGPGRGKGKGHGKGKGKGKHGW
jgi:hypothetical protein